MCVLSILERWCDVEGMWKEQNVPWPLNMADFSATPDCHNNPTQKGEQRGWILRPALLSFIDDSKPALSLLCQETGHREAA